MESQFIITIKKERKTHLTITRIARDSGKEAVSSILVRN
jgi:hypothetical protein